MDNDQKDGAAEQSSPDQHIRQFSGWNYNWDNKLHFLTLYSNIN